MRLFAAIIIAFLIYKLQNVLYRKNWNKNLGVSIEFRTSECSVGDENALIETINNAKSLPLPVLHAKFAVDRSFTFLNRKNAAVSDLYHRNDVFCVLGNQKITRQLEFRVQKRGYFEIPAMEVVAKDFFLLGTFADSRRNVTSLHVYPAPIKGAEIDNLSMTLMGELAVRRNVLEDPFMFGGIREYSHNDSMRKVNWKASARTGELMVNMYQYSSDQYIKVLLNMETNMLYGATQLQEVSISLVSEICGRFLQDNIPVMFASNGIDKVSGIVDTVEPGSTTEHKVTIDKCLARIEKSAGGDSFFSMLDKAIAEHEKNVSYIVISPYYKEDLLEKLDSLVERDVAVRMIVPYFDTDGLSAERSYIHGWAVKFNEL
ncbi:MAG: DUF58 domain-containing protein [Eubacteriales bacterium]|nr:DUF58 domain-containing protein [Eubacteriales bacterium]